MHPVSRPPDRLLRQLLPGIAVLALLAACSNADLATPADIAAELAATTEPAEATVIQGAGAGTSTSTTRPGDGRQAVVALDGRPGDRALAALAVAELEALGYEVPDPERFPLDARSLTLALGEGDVDVWVGRWSPLDELIDPLGTDGELAGDRTIDLGVVVDGLQVGLALEAAADSSDSEGTTIEDPTTAEPLSLWELLTEPGVARVYDHDDDGRPEIWGCGPGSGCAAWLLSIEPLLPVQPGLTVALEDVVQLPSVDDVRDPARDAIVFAASRAGSNPEVALGPAGERRRLTGSSWLGDGLPAGPVTATTEADTAPPLPPGPIPATLTVAVSKEWAADNPVAAETLAALRLDASDLVDVWADLE